MIAIDSMWADPATWNAIKVTGQRFSTRHYWNALDLQILSNGSIVKQPEERRIYNPIIFENFTCERNHYATLSDSGVSYRASDCQLVTESCKLAPDFSSNSILDFTSSTNHFMDRITSNSGSSERSFCFYWFDQ